MAYVPEDRLGTGLALGLKVSENLMLKAFRSRELSWGPFVSSSKVRTRSEALIREFEINGTSETLVKHLSGGQAQKVLLARELSSGARVVVAAAPTRGLDVAATDSVRQVLLRATASGVAVLLITEDLDEVMDLADRIAVVYEGRIMGVVDAQGADREQIGLMMAGIDTTP
jgi:simple sugar transport system ATP-binding protein